MVSLFPAMFYPPEPTANRDKKKKKKDRNFEFSGISLRKGSEREEGFAPFSQKKARLNVKPEKPSLQGVLAYGNETRSQHLRWPPPKDELQ